MICWSVRCSCMVRPNNVGPLSGRGGARATLDRKASIPPPRSAPAVGYAGRLSTGSMLLRYSDTPAVAIRIGQMDLASPRLILDFFAELVRDRIDIFNAEIDKRAGPGVPDVLGKV